MIKLLKDMPKEFFEKFSEEEIEFMQAWEEYYIQLLMQRDRAKEPMTDMFSLYCGECRHKVGVYGLVPRYNFCPMCGSRIKTNEEENTMKLEDFIKKHGNVNVDEKELKKVLGIKDEKYFVPVDKENYWSVNHIGDVKRYENSSKIEDVFANNKIFRTKREAEEYAEKQRFLLKMERDFLDNSDVIDWEDGTQAKYNMVYDNRRNYIRIDFWVTSNYGILVTTNREWLKEYIEKYEEEIRKYYFEIKEEKK